MTRLVRLRTRSWSTLRRSANYDRPQAPWSFRPAAAMRELAPYIFMLLTLRRGSLVAPVMLLSRLRCDTDPIKEGTRVPRRSTFAHIEPSCVPQRLNCGPAHALSTFYAGHER